MEVPEGERMIVWTLDNALSVVQPLGYHVA